MASLEAEGLAPKFHLCDLANLATVEALRDTMVERLGDRHASDHQGCRICVSVSALLPGTFT